jgi:hypothetical protein
MPNLDPTERECLRRIARGNTDTGVVCTDQVLRRLAELGLIEQVPTLALPLEMPRSAVRLTTAGHAALAPG